MLARFLPTMLRATTSGRLGIVTVSPILTIQDGPSASRLTSRGRASFMRTMASPSGPRSCSTWRIVKFEPVSAERSILASVSNTIHTMSARRKTADAVGTAKGNSMRRLSPEVCSSATTGAFGSGAGPLRAAAAGAGGFGASAASTFGAAGAAGSAMAFSIFAAAAGSAFASAACAGSGFIGSFLPARHWACSGFAGSVLTGSDLAG